MTPEEKRTAYYTQPSAKRKAMAEMNAFTGFVSASGINTDPSTVRNEAPPMPDISCTIGGVPHLFELGEITDEGLAEQTGIAQRTQADGEGGVVSEEQPLVRMILKKAQSTYETGGAALDLVLHYDKQYPISPAEYLDGHEAEIAKAMAPNGPFSRIWIYDGWEKRILWKRG